MKSAILSIGTELTRGELVNGNAAWLSERLTQAGFTVTEHLVVDDDEARIIDALARLSASVSVVVCTGGLGPTTDDLTTETVARYLGVPMRRDAASLAAIEARFARFGRVMSPSNAKQADFPEAATVLPNPVGTAPGFSVNLAKASASPECRAFFLPGVPREMQHLFQEEVLPRIADLATHTSHQIRFRTFGLPESVVGEKLAGVEAAFPGVILGYRAHFPEIEVKVLATATDAEAAATLAEQAAAVVAERLGDVIYTRGTSSIGRVVVDALTARKKTLALAESCTGGLVSSLITREHGASAAFLLGAVTYANEAKQAVLGVPAATITAHGAVSPETAAAMAEGARKVSGADYAVAITGVAGPDGGSDEKPVGTVHFAIASAEGTRTEHRLFRWPNRDMIQTIAAYTALDFVRRAVR
jgi:nicotinamide-nucleotide amidase